MRIEFEHPGTGFPHDRARMLVTSWVVPVALPLLLAGLVATGFVWHSDSPADVKAVAVLLLLAGLLVAGQAFRAYRGIRRIAPPEPRRWVITEESVQVVTEHSRSEWRWTLVRSATAHPDRYRLAMDGATRIDLPRPEDPASDARLDRFLRESALLPPR